MALPGQRHCFSFVLRVTLSKKPFLTYLTGGKVSLEIPFKAIIEINDFSLCGSRGQYILWVSLCINRFVVYLIFTFIKVHNKKSQKVPQDL